MSDENWGIYVGNMISQNGQNWLEEFQKQQSRQQQKSKNPFARKLGGGDPCEDVKKQELIDCIANGILLSFSKKLSGGGRVRRVRRTYKKSQQRQQKQTRKNTKQLRNKKRSIV